ncbi:hypothetical protein ACXN5S_11235 [Pseudoroseicyclus sp. H15]
MTDTRTLPNRQPLLLFAAVLLAVLLLTPFTGGPAAWIEETGAVETMSFILWMLCPLLFLWLFPPRAWARYPHMISLVLLLAFREAPFDVWIIDFRLLNPAFYAAEGFTLSAIFGGAIAIFVVASVVTLFVFGIPALWRALKERQSWPKLVLLGFGFAAVGQLFEKLHRFISPVIGHWLTVVSEELCELVFVTLVVAAILSAGRLRRAKRLR